MESAPGDPVHRVRAAAWLVAGWTYFGIAILAGLLYSLQFLHMYPFPSVEWLSPGRVRVLHTNGMAFGTLAAGMFGLLEYVIPRLTGRPVLSQRLGWIVFGAWNALILATAVLVLAGYMQGIEWGETPAVLDPFIVAGLVLAAVNFLAPVARSARGPLYVSLWYFAAAFAWTGLNYMAGNFLPQYWVAGTAGASVSSMYIHDLVGLFVTPLGWGLMYYMVPAILKAPVYSHRLSFVGFWSLAFFYPLNSVHHYLLSPIPMWMQRASVVASVAIHLVVYGVVLNFLGILKGRMKQGWDSLPVRWFMVGALFYLFTCVQCAIQVGITMQKTIHFTDWVVGHAHLVMFGVFVFWLFGFTVHLWPRLVGAPETDSSRSSLLRWHFWLTSTGVLAMWIGLSIAGVLQGRSWNGPGPFTDSLAISRPYWLLRTLLGVAIVVGQGLFFLWLARTALAARRREAAA
jgi:cytochrome c oxidase cbb3-type subunit 1